MALQICLKFTTSKLTTIKDIQCYTSSEFHCLGASDKKTLFLLPIILVFYDISKILLISIDEARGKRVGRVHK